MVHKINLVQIQVEELSTFWQIQKVSFQDLLTKYQDFETNPSNESLERVSQRYQRKGTKFYFITSSNKAIGGVVVTKTSEGTAHIGPIFIKPTEQGKGYGQIAMLAVEKTYPEIKEWQLDTIKEERKLIHLYQKIGYQFQGNGQKIKENMTIIDLIKISD
ncbi:MAG: GNAT family N-acetyltransferase [Vagococcus salmoninarum]|uniref:GNAT family N-acetyltransferase n=1 Tax=Vagococcus salmoninarum TaxID=2739 RepID=UPI003F9A8926